MAKKNKPKLDTYVCSKCENNQFKFKGVAFRAWSGEIRVHTMLICAKCNANYDVQPCNTNGLKTKNQLTEGSLSNVQY